MVDIKENKKNKDVFVIGGNQIVDLLLDYCDEAIITKIDAKKDADTFLHNFDKDDDFEIVEESEEIIENNTKYKYITYKRVK